MIEVELPDGSIAEFPDGTPQETIKGVLQKQFGAPAQAPAQPEAQPDRPWYMDAAQAADDMVRLAAQGMTFGYADKLAGFLGGEGTEAERAKTQAARGRAGGAGTVAELGGAVATPLGLANRGLSLAGRFGTGAMSGARGLAARSALMGAEGAGYGALHAAGNDQDIGTGAAIGAAGGVLGNVAGEGIAKGVSKVAGAFNKKSVIPSIDDINSAKSAAYSRAEQAGVAFTPNAVSRIEQKVVADLTDMGFDPALQPGAAAVLKRLEGLRGQNVTLKGLDTLRKVASNGYIPGNRSNNAAISRIIETIDDVVANPQASDVLMGNAQAGARALQEARGLASRASKLERVENAVNSADLRAASTGSGGNVDNATRQNLRRLLEKPRGFTADERAALEKVVRGTTGQNALRLAGKLSPQGNGLMAALGIGGTMVNPLYGVASLGGMGAKAAADRMTTQNVKGLLDLIAAGGSASALQPQPNLLQLLAQSQRENLGRGLMGLLAQRAGVQAP